jgi:hypothetical protein
MQLVKKIKSTIHKLCSLIPFHASTIDFRRISATIRRKTLQLKSALIKGTILSEQEDLIMGPVFRGGGIPILSEQ